jgi:SAM-dependent methyltransferase
MSIDELFLKIRECVKYSDLDNAMLLLTHLKARIAGEIIGSSRWKAIQMVEKFVNGDKDAYILDYGCGGGHTIIYLHLMGYKNVYGVDLISEEKFSPDSDIQDNNNTIMQLLGLKNVHFHNYDGGNLPFNDNRFDFVFSEQVLEHVFSIDQYYKESFRVMKHSSVAYFVFPHKFCPYDSHGQTWFVHMLPKSMVLFFYKILGRNVEHLAATLNFQTIFYHRKVALKYFFEFNNITSDVLKQFTDDDLSRFKGNKSIRKVIDLLIRKKYIGPVALRLFSIFSMANLVMRKGLTVTSD